MTREQNPWKQETQLRKDLHYYTQMKQKTQRKIDEISKMLEHIEMLRK